MAPGSETRMGYAVFTASWFFIAGLTALTLA